MENNTQYIPAFKGYERVGQFPLEKYSKFNSQQEARQYANLGRTKQSAAYPGQIISVTEGDKVLVFAIDKNFQLVGITSTTTTDESTYVEITYETLNNINKFPGIYLTSGSYLKSLTITIIEPFKSYDNELIDNGFDIKLYTFYSVDETSKSERIIMDDSDFLTSEVGDYVVLINNVIQYLSKIDLVGKTNSGFLNGRAILKIN